MRKVSSATVAMILAIALYFTLFWGFDALRVPDVADLRSGRCLALAVRLRYRQSLSTGSDGAAQARRLLRDREARRLPPSVPFIIVDSPALACRRHG